MRAGILSYEDFDVLVLEVNDIVGDLKRIGKAAAKLGGRELISAVALAGLRRGKDRELLRVGEVWAGMINGDQGDVMAAIRASRIHSHLYKKSRKKTGRGSKVAAWVASDPVPSVIAGLIACMIASGEFGSPDAVAVVMIDDDSLAKDEAFHRRMYTAVTEVLKPLFNVKWVRTMKLAEGVTAPATIVRGDLGTVTSKDKAAMIVSTAYDMDRDDKKARVKWIKLDEYRLREILRKGWPRIAKLVTKKEAERREMPVPSAWVKLVRNGTWRLIKTVGEYGVALTPVTAVNYLSKIVKDKEWEQRWNYFDHSKAWKVGIKALELHEKEGVPPREAVKRAAEEVFGKDCIRERKPTREPPVNAAYRVMLKAASQWTSYFPWKEKWWYRNSPRSVVEVFKQKLRRAETFIKIMKGAVNALESALSKYDSGDPKLWALDGDLVEAVELMMVAARLVHEHDEEDTDLKEIAKELAEEVVKAMSRNKHEAKEKAEIVGKILEEHAKDDSKPLTRILRGDREMEKEIMRDVAGEKISAKRAIERLLEKARETGRKVEEVERKLIDVLGTKKKLEVFRDWFSLLPRPPW